MIAGHAGNDKTSSQTPTGDLIQKGHFADLQYKNPHGTKLWEKCEDSARSTIFATVLVSTISIEEL